MKPTRSLLLTLTVLLLLALALPTLHAQDSGQGMVGAELTPEDLATLHEVRVATAPFRSVDAVTGAGYAKFQDCFRKGDDLGMGQHYLNAALLDDQLDPTQPEALVYEMIDADTPVLSALEYIVPAAAWDPNNTGREAPTLYGQPFMLKTNIPDTPPIWALHVWLWSANPDGLFADWNPIVVCPADMPSTDFANR